MEKQRNSILKALAILKKIYKIENSDIDLAAIWQMALNEFSDEQIQSAVEKLIKTRTSAFFPVPGELIACMGESHSDRASKFDSLVAMISQYGSYHRPEITDPELTEFIKRSGGWKELCRKSYEELSLLKKSFCYTESSPINCPKITHEPNSKPGRQTFNREKFNQIHKMIRERIHETS